MGRGHNRQQRDDNEAQMAQTPERDLVRSGGDDLEFAKELDDRYELEAEPGFAPTGVRRKDGDRER